MHQRISISTMSGLHDEDDNREYQVQSYPFLGVSYKIYPNKRNRLKDKLNLNNQNKMERESAAEPVLELLCDEKGCFLKAPGRLPSGRQVRSSRGSGGSSAIKASCVPAFSCFNCANVGWELIFLHFQGPLRVGNIYNSHWTWSTALLVNAEPAVIPGRGGIYRGSLHTGTTRRLPWVKASGNLESRFGQAASYIKAINFRKARLFDQEEMILGKVVCNLRYHHDLSPEHTVELICSLFNRRAGTRWSSEGVRLTYDLVNGLTPSLGLEGEDYLARKLKMELGEDVADLINFTLPGGRVAVPVLFSLFQDWNPENRASIEEFGSAIRSVTGVVSKPSKNVRYYSGFHLSKERDALNKSFMHSVDWQVSPWLDVPTRLDKAPKGN